MAKFKVKFEIEKLKMEIEGERDTLPGITQGLKQHFAGLLQAPTTVSGVEERRADPPNVHGESGNGHDENRKRKRRNRVSGSGEEGSSSAVEFRHDSAKFGNPKQEWKTQ